MNNELPQGIKDNLYLLREASPSQRKDAAEYLGKTGNTDSRIIDQLVKAANSDDVNSVREAAKNALENLHYKDNLASIREEISKEFIDNADISTHPITEKLLYLITEQQTQIIRILNEQNGILENQSGNLRTIALVAGGIVLLIALGFICGVINASYGGFF